MFADVQSRTWPSIFLWLMGVTVARMEFVTVLWIWGKRGSRVGKLVVFYGKREALFCY